MSKNVIIIMAGGLGKRMNSDLPKVLHKINWKPLLLNVVQEEMLLNPIKILIVVGKYKNIIECSKNIYKTEKIRGFYKGVIPPIIGIGFEKCIVFGTYSNVKNLNIFQNVYSNIFLAGIISGICCTSVVTPVEKVKIIMQNAKMKEGICKIIKKEGIASLYKGWSATLFREVPGYGIYFTTYEFCKNNKKINIKLYNHIIQCYLEV